MDHVIDQEFSVPDLIQGKEYLFRVCACNKCGPGINYNRFVVHGLETGEQYIFRVKAVNAVGFSENSQESEAIKVQAALTCPSYPHGITLLNCDGHSMTLGWKAPKYSGDPAHPNKPSNHNLILYSPHPNRRGLLNTCRTKNPKLHAGPKGPKHCGPFWSTPTRCRRGKTIH